MTGNRSMGAWLWLFKCHGVPITVEEAQAARLATDLSHWQRIRALGQQPRIAAAWQERKGRPFDDRDADALCEAFFPISAAAARDPAIHLPGA